VLTCIDSRVQPSEILDLLPGDAFISRTVANLVPPCREGDTVPDATAATLEFAVLEKNVQHIIVLGHSRCGGIDALMNQPNLQNKSPSSLQKNSFINSWVNMARPVKEAVLNGKTISPEALAKTAEEQALIFSFQNLKTYSFINERIKQGSLSLHAWRFEIETGKIYSFKEDTSKFEELMPDVLPRAKM
jgi:carbonic anhydrase